MKKNELRELKNLSIEELKIKEAALRQELFSNRLSGATTPVKNNQRARIVRKDIARVLTHIRYKQAQG